MEFLVSQQPSFGRELQWPAILSSLIGPRVENVPRVEIVARVGIVPRVEIDEWIGILPKNGMVGSGLVASRRDVCCWLLLTFLYTARGENSNKMTKGRKGFTLGWADFLAQKALQSLYSGYIRLGQRSF